MPKSEGVLYRLAEPQAGYFTTAQAQGDHVSRQQLWYLQQTGAIERAAHGVYRLTRFPAQRFEDLVVACLWAGPDAVVSHETALIVYGVGDAMPPTIHLTLPRRFRGRRPGITVHRAPLESEERTVRDAVPVTTVDRTLVDVAQRSDPDLADRAARAALATGLTTRSRLRRRLHGHEAAQRVLARALASA